MTLSGVLLAGGRSSRMGRDKALLEIDGEPLWQRQWRKLLRLRLDRLILSVGSADSPLRPLPPAVRLVDAQADSGPLGGIVTSLEKIALDGAGARLLVLGVDLPLLPLEFLEDMIFASVEGCGAVGRQGNLFQPLAAVYPVEMTELGRHLLRLGHFSLQGFIRAGLEHGLMVDVQCREYPAEIFHNLNTPEDLAWLTGEIRPSRPAADV